MCRLADAAQGVRSAKKYPLIVEVHGGPASAELARWGGGGGLSPAAFSALGYFVLLPNPRGASGRARLLPRPNRKDFGYGDLRDILAGVDTVLAKYTVDPNRVGIAGWSYGGFMTMFCRDPDATVQGGGGRRGHLQLAELLRRELDRQWMTPYFGASVYDAPAVYARSSAINFIQQAHTPTLVVVGDRDGECPRRSPTSSGMRCGTAAFPRNWWSIPTKAMALWTQRSARRAGAGSGVVARTMPPGA